LYGLYRFWNVSCFCCHISNCSLSFHVSVLLWSTGSRLPCGCQ
jgi:hypothetical protein